MSPNFYLYTSTFVWDRLLQKNFFEVFIALKVQVLLFCSFLSLTNAESGDISSTKKALFHITHKVAVSNKHKSIFILPFLSFSCSERCSSLHSKKKGTLPNFKKRFRRFQKACKCVQTSKKKKKKLRNLKRIFPCIQRKILFFRNLFKFRRAKKWFRRKIRNL
jgi:hypothetical protein